MRYMVCILGHIHRSAKVMSTRKAVFQYIPEKLCVSFKIKLQKLKGFKKKNLLAWV